MRHPRRLVRWVVPMVVAGLLLVSCSDGGDATTPDASTPAPPIDDASATPTGDESGALSGDGLDIGVLAPSSGLLATLFQGQVRGIDAAAADIAESGGVLDGPVRVTTTQAPLDGSESAIVEAVLDGGASALIGPAGATDAPQVRAELEAAGAIGCTASASLPGLTAGQESFGLFRTALPDDVVVSQLADAIIARRDAESPNAAWKVAIVARSDDYGLSVGNGLAASLESRGLDPSVVGYSPGRVLFVGTAAEVTELRPDLTVIVSYEEGAAIVTELIRGGIAPASMIGLDSFFRPRIATLAGPDGDATAADGFTMIGTTGNRGFLQRLFDDDPNGQVADAAQAYDCAIVLGLSTEAVAVGSSATISDAVRDVTAGGTTCTTYGDCLDKLSAGEDIDYDGASGKLAIDDQGDPTFGRFTVATIEDGEVSVVETVDIDIAQIRREQAAVAAAAFTTRLQQALRFLGFYSGPIDGLEGPELTAALAAFQESAGLQPTGVYDEATDAALRAALGEYESLLTTTTSELQVLLAELGYYEGPIDGVWSADLTAAIRALQRELGVPETGVIDAATIKAAYERGVINGSVPPPAEQPPATPTPVPPDTPPPSTPEPEPTAAPQPTPERRRTHGRTATHGRAPDRDSCTDHATRRPPCRPPRHPPGGPRLLDLRRAAAGFRLRRRDRSGQQVHRLRSDQRRVRGAESRGARCTPQRPCASDRTPRLSHRRRRARRR